ncbi:MAG: TPM domain-containing protein [Bacteroidetes bacterium]|nr:MAG: TPM domain-containing protein [Bacteroidota bacterium]
MMQQIIIYTNRVTQQLLGFVFIFLIGSLQALPPQPSPPRLVNDFENILTAAQVSTLESKLANYANTHQTQIAIIITDDLYGLEIADFSTRLGTAWEVGKAGFENGIVITVAPQKRDVYIAVGYGLEGVIPDITARRIVENEILPAFRSENYFQGLDNATNVIMQLAAGEFPASEYAQQEEVPSGAVFVPFILIILLVFFLSRRRRNYTSPGKSIPFWTMLWLLSHGSRGSRGSYGNFSSGRGSFSPGRGGFGGGRPGGFGGFGGGRFGGGGAGGSW